MLRFGFWLSVARAGFWVQQDRKGFTWQVQPLALSGRQQVQGAPGAGLIPQGFQQDLVKEMCWGHFRAEGSKAIPEKPSCMGLCVHMSVCPSVFLCSARGGTQHRRTHHRSQHDLEALGIQSLPSIIILSANLLFKPINSRGEPLPKDALWLPGLPKTLQVILLCCYNFFTQSFVRSPTDYAENVWICVSLPISPHLPFSGV